MTVQAHTADKRLVVLAVLGVVLALTAAMWSLAGCAPKDTSEAPAQSEKSDSDSASTSGASAMDGQPVNWTMESDCSMCHTSEAASETDTACPQGTAHKAEGVTCTQCHTDESTLKTEHADVKFGDKVATKATVITVDAATCESCHGTLEDMASKTADSTALTDDKGTTVNPHERPAGEKHDENPATCTDCHNNHSKDLNKDAMKYCAQCHHRGTFECGTCHELRERSAK
ncbi:cytochrome c3 family protein [Eggerthella sinensis]|jgi:hypothetical protein|uniref:Tetrahaem cytochrome domain-containing protein n=1 Tax=Eggerthella sinensis TaxID=242230 RepID=A0A3N0IUX2_9ACTN|nr:cytochrome c3 family protein [Eggerthella sinensis]MCB7036122.1 cytochrome c3 family protein [Eggerthella sinensis]RDB68019.1 hypothetical protein C1876_11430 [Eggerthella sinensis]RNM40486.1 hypothetical protein DMP09_14155 [Eggerthella sinensis]